MKIGRKFWVGRLARVPTVLARRVIGFSVLAIGALCWTGNSSCAAAQLSGSVLLGGGPVADSMVTLWSASAAPPMKLGETRTQSNGEFAFPNIDIGGPVVHYVIANGGHPTKGSGGSVLTLLALLGPKAPEHIIVNELTNPFVAPSRKP
jgi:hypothetical protein